MMQSMGYVVLKNEKVFVLFRDNSFGRLIKVRDSGKDGVHLEDEEFYLDTHPEVAERLLQGKTVIA